MDEMSAPQSPAVDASEVIARLTQELAQAVQRAVIAESIAATLAKEADSGE